MKIEKENRLTRILNTALGGIVENLSWVLLLGMLTILATVIQLPFTLKDPFICLVVVVCVAVIVLAIFGAILFAIVRDQPWMIWIGMYAFLRNGLTYRDVDRLCAHAEKMYLAFAQKTKRDRDIDAKIESLLWQNVLNCDIIRELAEARGELTDTFGMSNRRGEMQIRALEHLCVNHAGRLQELFPDEPGRTLESVMSSADDIPEEVRECAARLLASLKVGEQSNMLNDPHFYHNRDAASRGK